MSVALAKPQSSGSQAPLAPAGPGRRAAPRSLPAHSPLTPRLLASVGAHWLGAPVPHRRCQLTPRERSPLRVTESGSGGEGERVSRWKSEAVCNLISKVTADYLCCAQLEVESLILALTRQGSGKTGTVILLALSLPRSLGGKASALL